MVEFVYLSRVVDAMCKNSQLVEIDMGVFGDDGLQYFAEHLPYLIQVKYVTIEEKSSLL